MGSAVLPSSITSLRWITQAVSLSPYRLFLGSLQCAVSQESTLPSLLKKMNFSWLLSNWSFSSVCSLVNLCIYGSPRTRTLSLKDIPTTLYFQAPSFSVSRSQKKPPVRIPTVCLPLEPAMGSTPMSELISSPAPRSMPLPATLTLLPEDYPVSIILSDSAEFILAQVISWHCTNPPGPSPFRIRQNHASIS